MWCRHCKQDVPVVAASTSGGVHCARCQQTLERPTFAASVSDSGVGLDEKSIRVKQAPSLLEQDFDQGRFDEIRRSLRAAKRHAGAAPKMLRFDPPEPLAAQRTADAPPAAPQQPAAKSPSAFRTQWVAWLIALTGAVALGAGLGLMFWSLSQPRPELWNWGVGATLGGQGLLIIGLVQLLASLWGVNREAAGALTGVQHELRRLGRTTEALVGSNQQGPTSFYADLARGASPRLLLANLKSQVDALSAHVTDQ